MDDLIFIVIEAFGPPSAVVASAATMKKLILGTIECIYALPRILTGVRMDNIQQNSNPATMGIIN